MPVQVNGKTLRQALWGEESYVLLFLLLLMVYAILSLVNSARWSGLVRVLPVALTVLFAMHTSNASRRMLRAAQFAVVLSAVAGILQAFTVSQGIGGLSFLLNGLLLLVTPVAILRRVLTKERVDIETMFAAVDVYILIGLIFATLFIAIAHLDTAQPFLAQPPPTPHQASDYVYLSFVTLTTVGFGDLTPYSNLARSVVVLEALMGQIFLVTLVARLVSLYSREDGGARLFSRERGPGRHRDPADFPLDPSDPADFPPDPSDPADDPPEPSEPSDPDGSDDPPPAPEGGAPAR